MKLVCFRSMVARIILPPILEIEIRSFTELIFLFNRCLKTIVGLQQPRIRIEEESYFIIVRVLCIKQIFFKSGLPRRFNKFRM